MPLVKITVEEILMLLLGEVMAVSEGFPCCRREERGAGSCQSHKPNPCNRGGFCMCLKVAEELFWQVH